MFGNYGSRFQELFGGQGQQGMDQSSQPTLGNDYSFNGETAGQPESNQPTLGNDYSYSPKTEEQKQKEKNETRKAIGEGMKKNAENSGDSYHQSFTPMNASDSALTAAANLANNDDAMATRAAALGQLIRGYNRD